MAGKKKYVCLVEDEATIANLITLGLEELGYRVEHTEDGKKGLELIVNTKPDLVLLDMMLPRLDGFGILEALAEKHILPDIPIIIISNSGQPIEIDRALDLGVRDYLIKVNFNPNEVMEKVQQVFAAEASRKKKIKNAQGEAGKKVLLVEDNTILSDALERKFREKHYAIVTAFNANAARKVLEKQDVAVILLDLVLPDEHGLTFLAELKNSKQWKDIPVIITSNLGQQEEINAGLRAGAVDYIVKTDTIPGEIFEKVEALLQKGQGKEQ